MSTKSEYKEIAKQIVEAVYENGIIFSSIGGLGKYFDLSTSRHDIQEYVNEITEFCDEDDEIAFRGITSTTKGTYYLFFNEKILQEKYPNVDNIVEIISLEAIKQLGFKKGDII